MSRLFATFTLLSLAGCAGDLVARVEAAHDSEAAPRGGPAPTPVPRTQDTPPVPQSEERSIVYNGGLTVQVADLDAAAKETRRIVQETKGWVSRADGASFTLRVPAALFEPTLDKLATLGRVLDRRTAASDVTDTYRDLDLRLKNAEQLRARLAALLEKAKDVKETIEVERELARVTEEIERLKGRRRAMADQIAHSVIMVTFVRARHESPAHAVRFPFPWIRALGLRSLTEFRR